MSACQGSGCQPAEGGQPGTSGSCPVCRRPFRIRKNGRLPLHSARSVFQPQERP